ERGDAGHDSQRLPDVVDVDIGGGLLGEPALEKLGDAGGELDVLDPAGDLAESVVVHLAVLAGDDRREVVGAVVEQLAHGEQHGGRLAEPSAKGLAAAVSRAIRDGALHPGDRLPPIRELAQQLRLSPTTVSAAWALLTRAGTLRTAGRNGTLVADGSSPHAGR